MNELLNVIESIRSEEATVERIFRGESGRPISAARRAADPTYPARLVEFTSFLADVVSGRRDAYYLREAMGISDFPLMFGDVLERSLLANYREWPASYRNYTGVRRVRDFRDVKEFAIDGAEAILAEVPPQTEYPERALTESEFVWAVAKYGAATAFAWEAIINDDLDALTDVPQRFGRAARRTEERKVTDEFVDANGPHAAFYTAGNNNIVNIANGATANNPTLTTQGLQDGLTVLFNQRDADGEPILIEAIELVVPPALEITADQIIQTREYRIEDPTGATRLITGNGLGRNLRRNTNPYIPVVASVANGATSWFLFGNPSTGRPALRIGFLRGHEEPEIWIKEPNARRVGGGAVGAMEGDFDTDSMRQRIRHVLGTRRIDPRATVASNGSGV